MKVKLLGYQERKEHKPANTSEYQDFDEGGIYWNLFFKSEHDNYFRVTVSETYGSCGSGYTSASWGDINKIEELNKVPKNLVKPIKDVFIELLQNNILNTKFLENKEPWDAQVEQLLSTDGELIAQSTGNGGCSYYPSGVASINKELFNN